MSEEMFPRIYEKQLKFYNKLVPEEDVYTFLYDALKDFPDIIVEYKEVPPLKPTLSKNEVEKAIIVSHNSDVLRTVYVIYRVINYGKTTMIAIYKTSNYRPPDYKYFKKKACFSKVKYERKLDGKWPSHISMKQIFDGYLISTRFHDSKNLLIGPKKVQYTQKKCPFTNMFGEKLVWKEIKSEQTPLNRTITRNETFHAFFYFCEEHVWNGVQEFIENQ